MSWVKVVSLQALGLVNLHPLVLKPSTLVRLVGNTGLSSKTQHIFALTNLGLNLLGL